jgi:hypothetical protein
MRYWWSYAGQPIGYARLLETQVGMSLDVILETANGSRLTRPMVNLSQEDQRYVRQVYIYNYEERAKAREPSSSAEEKPKSSKQRTPVADAYGVLDLEDGCSLEAVRAQYGKLCRQYHPDRNPEDPECERKQKQINAAFARIQKYWETRS